MVRAAVRTLTLNVYRIRNPSLIDFILGQARLSFLFIEHIICDLIFKICYCFMEEETE